tara:strand:+ start:178 stop:537 length:360 start_codon:yes stop_codon:yes gene_type:complete
MANPNIVNVATINGQVAGQAVGTSLSAIVTNSAGSGKIYKVNSLIVANIDGTNNASIDAVVDIAGTDYYIAKTVTVPADASIVVISKEAPVYLTENSQIELLANATGDLHAVVSYDEIS